MREKLTELLGKIEGAADPATAGVDLGLEAEIIHALCGSEVSTWPAQYRRLSFNPTARVDDALDLVEKFLPGWDWEIYRTISRGEVQALAVLEWPAGQITARQARPRPEGRHRSIPIAILGSLFTALIAHPALLAQTEASDGR